MTAKEFLKGWFTLIAQPWGARYEGETDVATAQQELYFATFKSVDPDKWLSACYALAAKSKEWPSISAIKAIVNPSGHPGPEQAWSMVAPKVSSDAPTIFVTGPMREAYGAALQLEGDMVAARMAFKESYTHAVGLAEASGEAVEWSIVPGTSRDLREVAIREAVKRGIVRVDWAMKQLPGQTHDDLLEVANHVEMKRLA